jgi:hypothetical protein
MFGSKKLNKRFDIEDIEKYDLSTDLPVTGKKLYIDDYFKDKTFLEKVKIRFTYYKNKIWHSWYDFIEGIKSLWRWKKVIWKDRTWGNHQILDILIHKIEIDANAMYKRDIVEEADISYEQMMRVVTLLKRYNDDNYYTKAKDKHNEKWGEDKQYFIELQSGNCEWKSEREDVLSPEDLVIEREEYNQILLDARDKRKEELKEALSIIEKHVDEWWD